MIDVAGRELQIGDTVAATYTGHPDMKIGFVTRFTPKKIVVGFKSTYNKGTIYEEHKFQTQVCLITKGP